MASEIEPQSKTVQIAGAAAVVSLLVAGVGGYFMGYYQGQQDLRLQIRNSFERTTTSVGAPIADGHSAPPPQPVWSVNESKSPVDDSPTVALSIAATKGPSNFIGGQQSSRLIIRCQEHRTEFYMALDEYLGSDASEVVYRIDDAPSQSDSWSKSTDGKAVFASDPVLLAQKVAVGKKFFARISDFQGTTYDVEFNTTGLAAVLSKVATACAWK